MTSSSLEQIHQRLHVTHLRGDTADARCPAHDDNRSSLTVSPGEHGGILLHCHAGCETQAILDAIGMTFSDISAEPHVVAVYTYRNENGDRLWDVERWEPKDFRCRPGLPSAAERRLYHSEHLRKARAEGLVVYVVEGEKDCESLLKAGEIAVCGVGGAGTWLPHYSDQLAGLEIVIVADNDDPGRAHGRAVARSLDGKAASVALTEPSFGKDISDQLDAGYGLNTLIVLSVEEELGIHRADRIRERQIEWLWPGYLPAGKLTIVEGDPGDGKSVMTCDLAARFSTGSKLPDGVKSPSGPTDVVMISAEDDPEDTIRPRLRVAGADLRRVHMVIEGSIPGHPFDLGRDMPALESFVTENHVGLVVIDPLMAFMPQSVDAYKDHEVRRALHPLTRMAMRTGCALLVVRHLTKGRTKAITAGGGSIAFIGAARVGFLVGPHPDDDSKRALSCVKINVGEKPATLGYKVLSDPNEKHIPRVKWDDEPLAITAQEILDGDSDAADGKDAREEAKEFLHELLCANHSGIPWQEIVKAGRREGHTEITLRRIRKSVAHAERNPVHPDGTPRKGTFWFINKVEGWVDKYVAEAEERVAEMDPFDKSVADFLAHEEPFIEGPAFEGGCDICDSEPAVTFGPPMNVRRCSSHNPLVYSEV